MATIRTNDGVNIHYEDIGSGKPLILIHGWDQSSKAFCNNIPVLSQKYRVIAVDLRGQGDSDKPSYGYRISRLATDVKQLLDTLNIHGATLLGWSMGCSVVWSYWDLYREEHISKIILVDEPPLCLVNEGNPHGFATNEALVALEQSILDDAPTATQGFVDMMLTEDGNSKWGQQTLSESLKFPKEQCTFLLRNHVYTDWRDVIPTITLPTLVIAAKNSHVKVENNEWTHAHIAGSQYKLFETRHMMFMEEADAFNAAVAEFID